MTISLTPVVADSVGEDVTLTAEGGGRNGSTDDRIAFQTMLGVFIPEVKGAIRPGRAEGAMNGMETDGVDRVDVDDVALRWRSFAMTFKGEVKAVDDQPRYPSTCWWTDVEALVDQT